MKHIGMNIRTLAPIICLFFFLIFSCEKNVEDDPQPEGMNCEPDISFVMDIQPIINNKCIMCHNGSTEIPDFRTYEVVKSKASRVKELTASRVMPQTGSLTDAQIALIGCWVDNGAPDN